MANTTCPAGSLRYSWRSGDTLVRIATAFGTTVSAMRDINPDIDFTKSPPVPTCAFPRGC